MQEPTLLRVPGHSRRDPPSIPNEQGSTASKEPSPRCSTIGTVAERIRLRIGNLGKAVLVTGQAYQDPKDALNEFVSNAADEYALGGRRGQRIRIVLRRKGRYPLIAVEDGGRGMDRDGLRRVASSLFDSSKAGDRRTIGEKAIGILAYQQLGGRCEIVTRAEGSPATLALRLERGSARAELEPNERRRARELPGTTVYVSDLDPDVLRIITLRKVVDYLRRRRSAALERGDYQIEVIEGRRSELVTAQEPEGVRLAIPPRTTLWGRIEFAIYVSPQPDKRRHVAVAGVGGTTIVDDLAELEEFDRPPWSTDQVSGLVVFEALKQVAGRRAVLRDREAFPIFFDAVRSVEPIVTRVLERVERELDQDVASQLNETVRRIFGRVLRELADVDNPMRTLVGTEVGQGGSLEEPGKEGDRSRLVSEESGPALDGGGHDSPVLDELDPMRDPVEPSEAPSAAKPAPGRSRALPTLAPDPSPDGLRSRFDPEVGVVFYNDRHPDYLLVRSDPASLLDYLATLVAKEYVLYNNPRSAADELAEEMIRMLVRVRRHLPRKM